MDEKNRCASCPRADRAKQAHSQNCVIRASPPLQHTTCTIPRRRVRARARTLPVQPHTKEQRKGKQNSHKCKGKALQRGTTSKRAPRVDFLTSLEHVEGLPRVTSCGKSTNKKEKRNNTNTHGISCLQSHTFAPRISCSRKKLSPEPAA